MGQSYEEKPDERPRPETEEYRQHSPAKPQEPPNTQSQLPISKPHPPPLREEPQDKEREKQERSRRKIEKYGGREATLRNIGSAKHNPHKRKTVRERVGNDLVENIINHYGDQKGKREK